MQEFYEILGLTENATDQEVDEAYKLLKRKYSQDRFLEGEAGNIAAKNLTKVETAYTEIIADRMQKSKEEGKSPVFYTEIEELIKKGDISKAQEKLDDISDRTAEWHYLQSVIFYKKNWMSESKKQLEIAMNMEPHNNKYADSYTKLKQKMEFNEKQFHSGNANYQSPNQNEQRQMGDTDSGDCLRWCATMCCMNLMCNMCCR